MEKKCISCKLYLNLEKPEDKAVYEKIKNRNNRKYRSVADYIYGAISNFDEDIIDYEKVADEVTKILYKRELREAIEQSQSQNEDERLIEMAELGDVE